MANQTGTADKWWIVILPTEYADIPELYGPFRAETTAQEHADRWNADHAGYYETASVLPIRSLRELT